MVRTWTTVGAGHSRGNETRLGKILDALSWTEIPPAGVCEPAMPALAIMGAIRELRLPGVTHYAISHALAPFGLVGIRAHYADGRADVYVVDEGSQLVVLASDFYARVPRCAMCGAALSGRARYHRDDQPVCSQACAAAQDTEPPS
jgi:hypothetical protein